MINKVEKVVYTSVVDETQVKELLEKMEENLVNDFGSEFFYYRLTEVYKDVLEDSLFTSQFEWSDDYLFASIDGTLVGYIFLGTNEEYFFQEETPEEYPHACIWDIYVLPEFRNKGLARKLIVNQLKIKWDEILEFQKRHEEEGMVRLGADALNQEAGHFFEKIGFQLLPFKDNEFVWSSSLDSPCLS